MSTCDVEDARDPLIDHPGTVVVGLTASAPDRPGRRAALAAAAGAALVAGAAAWWLAATGAERFDEFHTLAQVRQPSPAALWRSWEATRDTLPPLGYGAAWAAAQVLGTGTLAVRAPVVLCWAVAAGVLALATRRSGPWAALTAGLVPSLSALLYLGAFARPYAAVLALSAVALWCWSEARHAASPVRWEVGAGAACALATGLHYAAAAVAVGLALAAAARARPGRPWVGRAVAPLAGAAVALVASASLLPRTVDRMGLLDQPVRPRDPVAFWVSAVLPAGVVVALACAVVAVVAATLPRAPEASPAAAGAGPVDADLLVAGAVLAVVVPVATAVAVALTSGTYLHRYAVGALVGGSVLAAQAVAAVGSWRPVVAPAVAVLAVAGVGVSAAASRADLLSVAAAEALPARLGLDRTTGDVVVLDEYELLVLRAHASGEVRARLRSGAARPAVAGSPRPVDLGGRLAAARPGDVVVVVGDAGQVGDLLRAHPGWTARQVARASYPRPVSDRVVGRYELRPPRTP